MKRTKRNGVTIQREDLPDPAKIAGMVQDAERAVREAKEDRRPRDRVRYVEPFALRVL